MGQESHEYGMPFPFLSPLLRGHLTHSPRVGSCLKGLENILSPRKSHSSLQQAELGSPLVCAVGWKGSPTLHWVVQELPEAVFSRF